MYVTHFLKSNLAITVRDQVLHTSIHTGTLVWHSRTLTPHTTPLQDDTAMAGKPPVGLSLVLNIDTTVPALVGTRVRAQGGRYWYRYEQIACSCKCRLLISRYYRYTCTSISMDQSISKRKLGSSQTQKSKTTPLKFSWSELIRSATLTHNTCGMARDFLAGAFGGAAGIFVGQPFDTLKVLQQTGAAGSNSSLYSTFRASVAKNGYIGLFDGMATPLLG